jgi:hypothetical protein
MCAEPRESTYLYVGLHVVICVLRGMHVHMYEPMCKCVDTCDVLHVRIEPHVCAYLAGSHSSMHAYIPLVYEIMY